MPRPSLMYPQVLQRLCRLALAVGWSWAVAFPATAAKDTKAHPDKAQTQQELASVRAKMEALAKDQAATASQRDSATAELARQANAVATASHALRQVDQQLGAKQRDLTQLEHKRDQLQQGLQGQHEAIAELLRASYTLGRGSDLRLLLGDDDVARISRALTYSKYFQQDRLERVRQLMASLTELQQTEAAITAEQQALQAKRADRAAQAKNLEQQRLAQQKLVASVDAKYKDQGQRLAALKQDEASLNQLLVKIQRAIDEAAREAARAARDSAAEPARQGGKTAADIRGNLPWPAQGPVHSYGNGVLITAAHGSEVHAVARGRVVYASFLRGYGMLLILNHGDGWMSMYGNNESLLAKVGDAIDAGQAIGTATQATGGNTGVYFELRRDGKPVDPRSWLSKQR